MADKLFYFALPDNENAFYAYINLIVNNKHNRYVAEPERRPKQFGPVKNFSTTRNEVGENFLIVYSEKDYNMLSMFLHQFALLRTYWEDIEQAVEYPNATRYDRAQYESRRHIGNTPKY